MERMLNSFNIVYTSVTGTISQTTGKTDRKERRKQQRRGQQSRGSKYLRYPLYQSALLFIVWNSTWRTHIPLKLLCVFFVFFQLGTTFSSVLHFATHQQWLILYDEGRNIVMYINLNRDRLCTYRQTLTKIGSKRFTAKCFEEFMILCA